MADRVLGTQRIDDLIWEAVCDGFPTDKSFTTIDVHDKLRDPQFWTGQYRTIRRIREALERIVLKTDDLDKLSEDVWCLPSLANLSNRG